ncbi:MAG TPA: hypothetical protein VHB79_15815 [Polyangiaceae bacterium]|nr:hypothetical protein [Polyangiaceae bacterium]
MSALGVATLETELDGALELGARALTWTEQHGVPLLASACCDASAVVLGALQREDTLRRRSTARFSLGLKRRVTTGTEAELDGAVLYHALALPRLNALYADATARTLLNRNLRAILRGYTAAGVPLRYFGTEVLSLLGHPVALVGYEQSANGAVLIEVLMGLEKPCVVRPALRREPPAALRELVKSSEAPRDFLGRAVAGTVERLGLSARDVAIELSAVATAPRSATAVAPEDSRVPANVAIPLGVVEAVAAPRVRVGGDLLVSTSALSRVEALAQETLENGRSLEEGVLAPLQGAPLDGARSGDVLAVLRAARQATQS